ncbi:MAG: hypothetical protein ACOVO2_25910 [Emticicia sp.]|uniref:hypothetical protein n=1 Tax=Emticicia TaxID=312278 RepID=UPI00273B8F3F|nr:hypothetical protein [Emticicia oligotrophica]
MATLINKSSKKRNSGENHPLNRTFNTANEAAKAKTDFIMNTVFKDVDWTKVKP